ncbi:MAG: exodeoxyribonuclease VII small subunit [Nitrospirae bacterium]|nr:exodeoxyribonuclease VII small subunit [Nitrospirota bacterium]
MEKEVKFEKAMERLEEIVQSLEKGDLQLEDSLKLFEEGIKLSQVCMAKLDEAEKRVDILIKDKDKTVLKPFLSESADNDNRKSEG